jgi:uncharacterized protein (TIGR03067 family)
MKKILLISLSVAALFASGCSTPSQTNPTTAPPESSTPRATVSTAFEGSWKGRDATPGHEGTVSLTFSGQSLEFHGTGTDDWLKGTFTVREDTNPKQFVGTVTDCAAPENIGKKAYAIYKIEGDTLTIAGYPLGDSDFPPAFDASGCRLLVLKRNQ